MKINWFKIQNLYLLGMISYMLAYNDYDNFIIFLNILTQGYKCLDCGENSDNCKCNTYIIEKTINIREKIFNWVLYNLPSTKLKTLIEDINNWDFYTTDKTIVNRYIKELQKYV